MWRTQNNNYNMTTWWTKWTELYLNTVSMLYTCCVHISIRTSTILAVLFVSPLKIALEKFCLLSPPTVRWNLRPWVHMLIYWDADAEITESVVCVWSDETAALVHTETEHYLRHALTGLSLNLLNSGWRSAFKHKADGQIDRICCVWPPHPHFSLIVHYPSHNSQDWDLKRFGLDACLSTADTCFYFNCRIYFILNRWKLEV